MKIICVNISEISGEKAHDTCCWFVAVLEARYSKITPKSGVSGMILSRKNTLKYRIFDFYKYMKFSTLRGLSKIRNSIIFNKLGNARSIR